jgi:hypothetical protein
MANHYDAQKTARIEQLEQLLDEYKLQLENMTRSDDSSTSQSAGKYGITRGWRVYLAYQ